VTPVVDIHPFRDMLSRARRFVSYLREAGLIRAAVPQQCRSAFAVEYSEWMRSRLGVVAATIAYRLKVGEALLATVEAPAQLDAAGVRRFIGEYVREHAVASAGSVTSAVRSLLRYLAVHSRCSAALIDAVPMIPGWRLARLPQYLPARDVERIIAACDRRPVAGRSGRGIGKPPHGQRDRAMVLLLARLGLRGADVVGLRLGDFDWKRGRVRLAGKSRREAYLPLPQDVGDAVLAYLKKERPTADTDRVFLRSVAPIRPLTSPGMRHVICAAIERSGVQAPSRGTHLLRHSLATRMLRDGATLDAIGAVLRHRDVNTTATYAKVDVALLRQIAQPWPSVEVSSC
jgi:site-specific recombinase XerD